MGESNQHKFYADLLQSLEDMREALSTLIHAQNDRNILAADVLKMDNVEARQSLISARNTLNVDILKRCGVVGEKFTQIRKLCHVSEFSLGIIQEDIRYDPEFECFIWDKRSDKSTIEFMGVLDNCVDNVRDYKQLASDLQIVEADFLKVDQEVDKCLREKLYQRFSNIQDQMDAISSRISKEMKEIVLFSDLSPGNYCMPPKEVNPNLENYLEDDWDELTS